MITKMTGLLTRVLDEEARLQIGALEYQVLVSESVRRQIQLRVGHEVTFHITEYLEGNAGGNRFVPRRIGFNTEVEAEFFDLFCTVEKIGAKKALKAMARPVKEIIDAIARQDVRWLSTLPGIGAATAEQIVTTLKRKIANLAAKAQPPYESAGEADASSDVAGENGKRRKKGASDTSRSPEPEPATALDGQLIDTVYQALLGLGHSPIEARSRLDYLLTLGKPFRNFDEAMTLIYGQRG